MARPQSIPEWQILGAARDVFLAKGIRATTAEVAERAGVAEGLLFHRYRTKADLFRAAMLPRNEDPAWLRKLGESVGKGELEANLAATAVEIIEFFRAILPLMMMSWSNPSASGLPALLEEPNPLPVRALAQVKIYFAAEMGRGRLRRSDPEILARAYLGALMNYAFFEVLLKIKGVKPRSAGGYARKLVALLMSGAAPARSGAAPARTRPPRQRAGS